MRTFFSIAFLFGAGVSLPAGLRGDEKKSEAKLEGNYTIVSGEEGGKALPAERTEGATVRITGATIIGTYKDKTEFLNAKYTLNTNKEPWKITMAYTANKALAVGLVKKEGDTLSLIYVLPGGEPPKEFKTKGPQLLLVLKHTKE